MADNPFDQFDEPSSAQQAEANPFDQFDEAPDARAVGKNGQNPQRTTPRTVSEESEAPPLVTAEESPTQDLAPEERGKNGPYRTPSISKAVQAGYNRGGKVPTPADMAEIRRADEVWSDAPAAIWSQAKEGTVQQVRGSMARAAEQYADQVLEEGTHYNQPTTFFPGRVPSSFELERPVETPQELARDVDVATAAEMAAGHNLRRARQAGMRSAASMPAKATPTERTVISGAGSGLASAATILGSTALTGGNPLPGIAALAMGSGGARYAELRDKGVPIDKARMSSDAAGALEFLTEFLPGETLVKRSPIGKKAVEFFVQDILGENASSLGQIADDYRLQLREDVTGQDLIDSIRDTTISTVAAGTVQLSSAQAMQYAIDLANSRAAERAGETPVDIGAPPDLPQQEGPTPVPAEEVLGAVETGGNEFDQFDAAAPPAEGAAAPTGQDAPAANEFDQFDETSPGSAAPAQTTLEAAEPAAPTRDARLDDASLRDALEASRQQIGTIEKGGLNKYAGDYSDPTDNTQLGSTKWVQDPLWRERPVFVNEEGKESRITREEANRALDRVQRGEDHKLTEKQRQYVSYVLDEADAIRAEWRKQQEAEAPRHEAEIKEAIPDFDGQDDVTKDITRIAKVASQYATEDELEHALEAQDDAEALRRLQVLVDRGWAQPEVSDEAGPELPGEAIARDEAVGSDARAGASESAEVAARGEDQLPSAEAGLTAAGAPVAEDSVSKTAESSVPATAASPPLPIFTGRADDSGQGWGAHRGNLSEGTKKTLLVDKNGNYFWGDRDLGSGRNVGRVIEGKHATYEPAKFGSTKEARAAAEQTTATEPNDGDGGSGTTEPVTRQSGATDLFGANVANSDALNKRNAKVAKKLGEGRAAPKPDQAPPGDIFRQQADKEAADAAAAQVDIEQADAVRVEQQERETKTEQGQAAAEAATNPANDIPEPTPAQKEAGNYAKGHVSYHGLDIAIENPVGSFRWNLDTDQLDELVKQARVTKDEAHIARARDALRDSARIPEAFAALKRAEEELFKKNPKLAKAVSKLLDKSWLSRLAADYGYIKGYIGKDKDHLDVYLDLPRLAEDPSHPVWVMDQKTPDGKFDEHKVFMGFENPKRIEVDYVKSFDDADFARTIMGKLRKFPDVAAFKEWLATGDLTKPVAEWKGDVQRTPRSAESDSAVREEPGAQTPVRSADGSESERAAVEDAGRTRPGVTAGEDELRDGVPAAAGERGDQQVRGDERGSVAPDVPAGSDVAGSGADAGGAGATNDIFGSSDPLAAAERAAPALDRDEKRKRQRAAEGVAVEPRNRANIAKTLPFLLEGQHDDVKKAEDRFEKPEGYGMLFTNGTGTGKTYTGLGVVKRMLKRGKKNGIIVVPSQKIADDWIKSALDLGIDIRVLESTKDAGKGVVITTYANFGANEHLADRNWDWTVADEAHDLMQNAAAEDTASIDALRAITLHPDGDYRRAQMLHRKEWHELERLAAQIKALEDLKLDVPQDLEDRREEAFRIFDELRKQVRADVMKRQGAARPRSMFLSATPFAYEKNVRWANGYLFNFSDFTTKKEGETLAYNEPGAYESFMVQHFGYRMRVGKLTEPDAQVDRTVMQRQFNTWMRKEGTLSARILEEPYDYDRKFVLVESKIGNKIDEGLNWLRKQKDMRELSDAINKRFDFLSRSRLLEALKAREVVGYIKQQHALGRKVLVFYDFNEGGGFNVFDVNAGMIATADPDASKNLRSQIDRFRAARPDLVALDTVAPSPLETLMKAFPNAKQYNGLVPSKKRTVYVDGFNNDGLPKENLILAQKAANKGWSAHDTTGTHSRVLINLGLPTAPTVAIQQEGRIYRVGQRSDAMFRYFNTGTDWEKYAFATTIARRASTAENLAMGEQARGLRDSFIQAFEDSAPEIPGGPEDGKGGKAKDRELAQALSEFDRAKSFYFGNLKKNSRTKAAEGEDYYATPEPLGLKMVEWARPKKNDDLLEPSAGHGAIARFFPELQRRTVIEPSPDLTPRLAMATDAKLIQDSFENLDQHNKYDVIVMNPPFGMGGSKAIPHLAKAFEKHLRDGGRIVALIPEGPAADKKFEKWYEETKGAHKVAEYGLPTQTFERAGTGVKTRVVVIDKMSEDYRLYNKGEVANGQMRRDIDAEDINDFFKKIENIEAPPRVRDKRAEETNAVYERMAAADEAKKETKANVKQALANAGSAPFVPVDGKHSKTGAPVFYAVPTKRVDYEVYQRQKSKATDLGGYWSAYKGGGAKPGFLFKSKEKRDEFIASQGEKTTVAIRSTGKARTPVTENALRSHVQKIVGGMAEANKIFVSDGFSGIRNDDVGLFEWLREQGVKENEWGGAVWTRDNGDKIIYLNSQATDSLAEAEQFVFHEATHRGFRSLLSQKAQQQLADFLFVQQGGVAGFAREKKLYFDDFKKEFDVNEPTHRYRLVDEALAATAEVLNRGEKLTDKLSRLVEQALAWINRWLRQHGWRRTFSKEEIRQAIRNMAAVGMTATRRNDTIESPVREMAAFATAAAQDAQRRRPAVKAETDAALALRDEDRALADRQQGLWNSLKKGQYLERAIRAAFLPPGLTINEKGEWMMSPLGRRVAARVRDSSMRAARRSFGFLRPLHEAVNRQYQVDEKVRTAINTVKQGLVDRWGTPPEFVLADYAAQNYKGQILDRVKKMVEDLEKSGMVSNRAEAEALQAILTGENANVTDARMQAVAEPIRQLIDQWGAEAVELGLLDKATFERNRATYLHRVYRKHEADWLGASGIVKRVDDALTARRRKIIGNQFKRRGISFDVTLESLRKSLPPDWWGRKVGGKKIDVALGESDWVVLSKVVNPREGTPDAFTGDTKGRDSVVARTYWPAEEPIPAKFAGWRNDGTFRAIKVTPNQVTLWRDFTKPERMKMGEILDTRYTFLKTALTAAHDLATGRLFRDIARNPEWSRDTGPTTDDGTPLWTEGQPGRRKYSVDHEWVHVPEAVIPGTSVKRYGQMAGKFIRASIWRDLNELEMGLRPGVWKSILTQFKKNKTTRNPKTHFFNTMSNVILAYIDDMRFSDWTKGVREWASNGPMWEEARLHGVFGHDFVEQEIKQDILRPMLERIIKESNADGAEGQKLKFLTRLFSGIRTLDEKATWAYQAEDEIFRMASYMQARKQGMGPDEAAIHARKQFIDYDIRAPWINALRYSVIPFISYTYRAIPRVMDAVAKRPWKIATLALLTYALNEAAYQLVGDDDEDEERRLMNEHARGHTWAFTPRMLRLPFNDEYENPVFLDMRNGLPAANIVDFENSNSAVPTPAWMQIGGPLISGVDFMQNYDAYRQEPIADSEVDTLGQKAAKGAKFLWSNYMPSWAPGGYGWDRVAGAVQGRMNQVHETSTIGMAVAQSVMPISVQSTEKNRRDRVREYERKLRALSEQAGDRRREFQKLKDPTNDDVADLRDALQEINSRRDQVVRERHQTLHGSD